ncbi:ATP-binding protein [bacterium]
MNQLIKNENHIITEEIPEKIYEELYSKADILYFRLDANLHILSSNITAQEKLAYERESLLNTSFLTFLSDASQEHVRKALNTCFQKGYIRDLEFKFQTQDQKTLDCLLNGLIYEDSENTRFLRVYIKDITSFKHANLANRLLSIVIESIQYQDKRSNALYQNVAKIMSCAGTGISLRLKGGESVISGYWESVDNNSDFGAKDYRRWHPQIWTLMIQKCQKAGAGQWTERGSFWTGYLKETISVLHEQGEKQAFESLMHYESLALISLDAKNRHQGYFVLLDQQHARWDENTVKIFESLSQDFLLAANPNNSDGSTTSGSDLIIHPWLNVPIFGVLITENGMIRHVNPWIETHIGVASEKMIGKSFKEIISPEFHDIIVNINSHSIPIGHFKNLGTIAFRTYQGNDKQVECVLTTLPIGNNLCELWYLLERKEDADFLARLQESKKMEALGILTGGIVHDFDNLLSTIIGFTALLREEIGNNNNQLFKDVQQISDTAEKAVQLTSRLLAYAHGNSYIVHQLNVNQLVNEVAGILSRTLDKNIVIRADLEKALFTIKADAGQIQQMILQVALNAREAMPHGGSLVFQTRNLQLDEGDPRLKQGCQSGNYVQIVISDTGLGMSGQIKNQIFEPHFSTKAQAPGKGLGLTMVRQIVEHHGGFASVFSEIGKGTVFKIHLMANNVTINQTCKNVKKDKNNKETILVIDDERLLRDNAKRILIRYGYNVLNAENAKDGMAVYKHHEQDIDLIILDLIMPNTDIKKVIASFRNLKQNIKILATIKSDEKNKVTSDMYKNCAGLIQKPFQISTLLKKVQKVLN